MFSASVLGVAKESLLSRVPVGRGRTDVRDYDNDYSRGSSREKVIREMIINKLVDLISV